jgi:hypothetical protein
MEHAMECNAYGVSYVQNILFQRRSAQGETEIQQLEIPQRPDWNDIVTEEPDLSIYDDDSPKEEQP